MNKLCLALCLAVCAAAHAGPLVYVPEAGVYVDSEGSGKVYPRGGAGIAVDPTTGQAFGVYDEPRRRAAQPINPADADCAIVKRPDSDKYMMKCRQ